jgi:hypothetical protein
MIRIDATIKLVMVQPHRREPGISGCIDFSRELRLDGSRIQRVCTEDNEWGRHLILIASTTKTRNHPPARTRVTIFNREPAALPAP